MYMSMHMCIHMSIRMSTRMSIYMSRHVCRCIAMHVRMCVSMHISIRMCLFHPSSDLHLLLLMRVFFYWTNPGHQADDEEFVDKGHHLGGHPAAGLFANTVPYRAVPVCAGPARSGLC